MTARRICRIIALLSFLSIGIAVAGEDLQADDEAFAPWPEEGSTAPAASPKTEEEVSELATADECSGCASHEGSGSGGRTLAIVLVGVVAAGLLVRTKRGHRLRPLFLLASLVFLGFGRGGCPCPVKGIQELVLVGLGASRHVVILAWFVALIPLTYLLGRVWCGWLCHLGALQDFLHRAGTVPTLTPRAARILRWVRRSLFVALLGQLLLTRRNVWESSDPFRAVFNLMAPATWLGWLLLIALLLSSLLVYRPFCRAACPVGLVLGWIGRLPGAARLRFTENCISCAACRRRCPAGAIPEDDGPVPDDCIACGECTAACPRDGALAWRHASPRSQ